MVLLIFVGGPFVVGLSIRTLPSTLIFLSFGVNTPFGSPT